MATDAAPPRPRVVVDTAEVRYGGSGCLGPGDVLPVHAAREAAEAPRLAA
ncbi:hypothetical protein AB0L41_35255 [Amycolatopsis mediterranei]